MIKYRKNNLLDRLNNVLVDEIGKFKPHLIT